MLRRFRRRYGHLLGLSRVSQKVRKISPIIDRSGIAQRLARGEAPAKYLAIVAIMQNEGPYLREWLEFHRLVGVEHFVLYDNDSSDETREVLEPYVRSGCVDLIPWPNFLAGANSQQLAYAHAAVYLTGRAHWFVTLDLDEFLFSPTDDDVSNVFREYDDLPALIIFERFFGPDGHEDAPAGLVIENYLKRLDDTEPENRTYKSAVKPEHVRSVVSAHRFHHVVDGTHGHDEQRRAVVSGALAEHTSTRLRINHNANRTMPKLRAKAARRYFGAEKSVELRRREKLAQHTKLFDCVTEDRDILRFVPALRKRLSRRPDEIEGWGRDRG